MGEPNLSLEFCGACLTSLEAKDNLINVNFIPAEDISYKIKLKLCVPEMILEKPEEFFLCTPCRTALETAYTFRCMCLRNEGKLAEIKQYSQKPAETTEIIKIKQEVIEPGYEDMPEVYLTETSQASSGLDMEPADPLEDLNTSKTVNPSNSENEPDQNNIKAMPQIIPKKTSELIDPNIETQMEVDNDKTSKTLSDLEIIQIACRTIPELIAYSCDVASLDCKVSLDRVDVPGGTVILPKKYFIRKCTKKYKKKFMKSKFKKGTDSNINYWCNICSKFIAIGRKHRYNAHMLNHRNIKSYKCDRCPKEFTYAETLSKHKRECTGVLPEKKTFQVVPAVEIKNDVKRPCIKVDLKKVKKEPYDVDHDWTDVTKAHKYIKVENVEADVRPQRVKLVNKQAYSMSNDLYHCEVCEYQTYKKHQYQVHMMKHFNDRRFECTQCPKRFFENWELNRHLRTVHLAPALNKRPPPNSYDIQNITAIQTNTAEITEKPETEVVKIVEPEPSVSFTVNSDPVVTPVIQSFESLAEDISDNGAISFACKVCDMSFKSHGLLMSHSHIHKTKHKCNICGQSYASDAEFLEHVKSHSSNFQIVDHVETHVPPKLPPKKKKKKKFFCTICNLEFASKDHANIHTGAKPYDCKVCGKEFAAYSTLRKHRWTHLDEPRSIVEDDEEQPDLIPMQRLKHVCDICGKSFMNKWQVNSHTCHSATGEAVYRCQICKNAFIGRTALIEHMGVHVNQTGDFYQ